MYKNILLSWKSQKKHYFTIKIILFIRNYKIIQKFSTNITKKSHNLIVLQCVVAFEMLFFLQGHISKLAHVPRFTAQFVSGTHTTTLLEVPMCVSSCPQTSFLVDPIRKPCSWMSMVLVWLVQLLKFYPLHNESLFPLKKFDISFCQPN